MDDIVQLVNFQNDHVAYVEPVVVFEHIHPFGLLVWGTRFFLFKYTRPNGIMVFGECMGTVVKEK